MKILLLMVFIFSCEKVGHRPVPQSPKPSREVSRLEPNYSLYDENVDVMVAFLWPEVVKTQEQRDSMRLVISSSMKLQKDKNRYFEKKLKLQRKFKEAECNCHLNSLCEEGQEPGSQDACLIIEEATYENDRELIPILELVELVKSEVLKCGGEWLETQSDLTELPPSRFDFNQKIIQFSALGPFDYEAKNLSFKSEDLYTRLTFNLPRKHAQKADFGVYYFDLGVRGSSASLTFQGDLFWDYMGKRRQGVIYWEHMHL